MQKRTGQKHMVDFLFPVALLFMFAVSAITVLLLATNIYRGTVQNSSMNDTTRTGLSYITEKIHRNDCDGAVRLGSLQGKDALIIEQKYNDELYCTYIYTNGNELKELFIRGDAEASPEAGRTILQVRGLTMAQAGENLLQFTCVDENGQTSTALVSTRSESEVQP